MEASGWINAFMAAKIEGRVWMETGIGSNTKTWKFSAKKIPTQIKRLGKSYVPCPDESENNNKKNSRMEKQTSSLVNATQLANGITESN